MKIQYEFVNGESHEIEVADELGAVLLDLDHKENNTNRKETRRHSSLDGMDYESAMFASRDDTAAEVELGADMEVLGRAMAALPSDQRALLHQVYFEGRSLSSIAQVEGVARQSIHERLQRTNNKIKSFFQIDP